MPTIAAASQPGFEPAHPGGMIRDLLDAARISESRAAAQIGVTAPALNNVVRGKSGISPEMALRLGRLFSNTPQFWTRMQEQFDLWHSSRALAGELDRIEPLQLDAAD